MPPRFPRFSPLLLAAALSCVACAKEEHKKRFGWFRHGARLYYDAYCPTDTTRDFRSIIIFADGEDLRMQESAPGTSYPLTMYAVTQRRYRVRRGGLFGQACHSCGTGIPSCGSAFDYLFAPNAPFVNQALPYYSCGAEADDRNYVLNPDTVVSVPYGTFHTYALKHPNGDRSYWSPASGLIMYRIAHNACTLRLNRIVR